MTAALTICVCIRNGEAHVDDCLEAIFRQADARVSVIAVDHRSTDGTAALLPAWEKRGLRALSFEGDGIGAVRDFAWRQATTAWVGFVDVDCRVHPRWLDTVCRFIDDNDADATLAAFGGENFIPRDEGLFYEALALSLPTFVGGHGSPLNRPVEEIRDVEHLPTLNVVYRRAALERIGGFDARFLRAAEDMDVSRRLLDAGLRLRTCPGMAVDHRVRSSLGKWLANMYLYGRARVFFFACHPRAFRAKFTLPIIVVAGYLGAPTVFPFAHVAGIAFGLFGEAVRGRFLFHVLLSSILVTALTHLAYGVGMLRQLVRPRKLGAASAAADRPRADSRGTSVL